MTWVWDVVGAALTITLLCVIYKRFGIDKIQSWLLWAVTQAEELYGSGTGKLKLAYVYDAFIDKFPKLQSIVPYSLFSKLVDKALETMRNMLKNDKIANLITNNKNGI